MLLFYKKQKIIFFYISLTVLFILIIQSKLFGQFKVLKLASQDNSFNYRLDFSDVYSLLNGENGKYLDFKYSLNEDKPGAPILPSKIIYIALPPQSKLTVNLSRQVYKTFNGIKIAVNPSVKNVSDSVLQYIPQNMQKIYFRSDQYPPKEYEILGYTWIRNYYCGVVKINTAFYNWKTKQTKILLSLDLSAAYGGNVPYSVNNSPESIYDKMLSKIIINYKDAQNFRSYRKLSGYADSTGNWINYNNRYIKLKIPSDGIYRIGYQDLINYGADPSEIDPSTVKIYCKGRQLPLYFKTENANIFSAGDFIEFWATKNYGSPDYRKIVPAGSDYLNYMNRYSDTTIVWLTWSGVKGERIKVVNTDTNNSNDTLTSYINLQHFEKDVRLWYYDASVPRVQLPFWQENKVWTWAFWGTGGGFSLPFTVSDAVPGSRFHTVARLISNAADVQVNAHKVGISINSNPVADTISFDYTQTVNFSSYFPTGILNNGSNTLKLTGLPTAGTFQQVLLDWIDIEYYRELDASNDSLYFAFPDSLSKKLRIIKISNIGSDSSFILYKVKPDTVKMENYSVSGAADKVLTFKDTVSGGDAYILIAPKYIKSPLFAENKKFLNLRKSGLGADDIIISNKLLQQSVSQYNDFIDNSYHIRTYVAYVDDIYDEFSYGYAKPEAIRNFLLYAYNNWTPPSPTYLTLIGDANYDYKNLWSPVPQVRKQDLVPSYGDPVSDNWYCTWDTTQIDIPQMLVGRIPASDNSQVIFYLGKYRKYLTRPYDEWNKTFLFFSGGDPSLPSELAQLKSVNDSVLNYLVKPKPVGGEGINFYKTINPVTNFGPFTNNQIQNSINNGGLFISYLGHSGTQTWDNGITSVNDLKNTYDDRFPLITDFGCSTGKFAEPDVKAFSELFLSESDQGQAIGYLGNSSLGYVSTAVSAPLYFYEYILKDTVTNIAEAHLLTVIKRFQENGYSDVNRVFAYCNILFGDPLINLRLPLKPNLSISAGDIRFLNDNPTSQDDYLPVKVYYHNYGSVPDDSVDISVSDKLNNVSVFYKSFRVPVPLLSDSLSVNIPVKNLPGEHTVSVVLDSAGHLAEIYKNDNSASADINIYSLSFRNLADEKYDNLNSGKITLLNPVYNPGDLTNQYDFQLDTSDTFANSAEYKGSIGIFYTDIPLKGLLKSQRYWWRIKPSNSSLWSKAYSFTYGASDYNWYISRPVNNSNDIIQDNTSYDSSKSGWTLATTKDELKIQSAGFSDGEFATMQYNRKELLSSTFFWGIATAIIDTVNLIPTDIKYFVYPNPPAGDSLLNYLKSLPAGTVLAMTVCDDAAQSVIGYSGGTPVRNEIKNWGSKFIDSVRYRESWCMIGRKGAAPGTVPEVYKKQFQGIAEIDTVKSIKYKSGRIVMPEIQNSAEWDSVHINTVMPPGTSLNVFPLGIKNNKTVDTLNTLNLDNGFASLKGIDARNYVGLKFLIKMTAGSQNISPVIKSLAVKYKLLPELGINYQVIAVSEDTLTVGGNEGLQFYVYNAGGAPADSFNVRLDLVNSDNSRKPIFSTEVDSLNPRSRRLFTANYNTSDGSGSKAFAVTIDPENRVRESYKDNNYYSIPFYIKKDTAKPTVDIAFDGKDIVDGEYVSSNPDIKISLNDPTLVPVTDTSDIQMFLNGKPVYYLNNNQITYSFSGSNPKFVINYRPELQNGEYNLQVIAKNSLGTYADSAASAKSFLVSGEARLLYVYNYPNPFKYDTYFTFKLTQIPDEIKIMIYTIAGRLIKTIERNSGQLEYDFNRIHWDGRDADGDILANGVYLYKVIMKKGNQTESTIQKLAIIR